MRVDAEGLEAAIGHTFGDHDILRRALTHKSHVHEKSAVGPASPTDNEQLEFLGDSVLGFLVSENLVRQYPELPEGRLSKLKAYFVSASHLHKVAQKLNLGEYLLLGRGEELSGGREKKALLANTVEALLAAVYLDGGIEAAREFVIRNVLEDLESLPEGVESPLADFKSALQEFTQARKLPQPRYVIVGQTGPEHAKTFTVEVRVGRDLTGKAAAFSKKSAGQKAARALLEKLMESSS